MAKNTLELPKLHSDVTYRPSSHNDAAEAAGSHPVWRVRFDLTSDPSVSFGLDINGDVVLGRGKDAPNLIDLSPYDAEDLGVSRRHAMLRPTTTNLFVVDVGSINGTQRNGHSIGVNTPYSLADGDTLVLGSLGFVVRIIKRPTGHTAALHGKIDLGEALARVAKAITSQLDIYEVMNQALEMAMGLTSAGEATIWLVDEQSGELFLEAERGIDDAQLKRMRLPVTDTMAGRVIETGKSLRISRKSDNEQVKIKTNYLVEAVVYVPLTLGGVTFGVLAAAHREPGQKFSARDEKLLASVADFTAIAIQNARLHLAIDAALDERTEELAERRQVEAALEESERKYRQLVEQSSDVVYTIDTEGYFTYISPAAEELTGYPARELVGNLLTKLVHPTWRERVDEFYRHLRDEVKPETMTQFPIVTGYGQLKWVEHVVTPVTDDEEVTGFQSTIRDVTERKQAEEAERERRAIAEALRDISAALNSTLDRDEVLDRILTNAGRVVQHDAASIMLIESGVARTVRSHGYEENGAQERALVPPLEVSKRANLSQMAETGQPFAIPDTLTYPGWAEIPELRWVRSWAGAPIQLEGEVIGFLSLDSGTPRFFADEHAQRLQAFADQAAVALKNAQLFADLEERNQELDAFSHTIAHDLKAPLNTILGYASLLGRNADMPDEAQDPLDSIKATAKQMGAMIDRLLQLAKLRHATEQAAPVEMGPVVAAAVGRFKAVIEDRAVSVEVAPDLPPALGHGPWLEEVFANLVGNAIKYIGEDNPDPRIAVRGETRDDHVRYEVIDNGLGIAPDKQATLFEMFTRFHEDQASGLGLGLAIVQRIVHKLGGEVGVESAPGQGSTFWFVLPAPEGASPTG